MTLIDFQSRTRLVSAPGAIEHIGRLSKETGGRRALVISDAGVIAAGHLTKCLESLRAAGLKTEVFTDVRENPTTIEVESGLQVARAFQPDLLIGLGGGSSMDCAKGINFLFSCGGRMEDYWGVGKATADMLPMIAIPTTAGTGSEAQSFALISQAETHIKMACGDPRAACRIAVLDPELTLTQPDRVTALTGVDAISHAVESHVTLRRNALSHAYSRQAWQMLAINFPRVLKDPGDLESRSQVQLGAFFSGLAIEASMLGAAHALANPLTAKYGITHGQAVGVMLPAVIRFNSPAVGDLYEELWSDVSQTELARSLDVDDVVESLIRYIQHLLVEAGLHISLESLGVAIDDLDELAMQASKQWTGGFNPRPVDPTALAKMYQAVYASEQRSQRHSVQVMGRNNE